MDNHAFLYSLLAFFAATVVTVPLFKKLGLSSVLGYLVAGSVLGPWGVGIFTNGKAILGFSELGVLLMLFVIGLELKPSRLWVMRRAIFGMGAAQMAFSTFFLSLFLVYFLGETREAALVAALGLSLSSTAFALQVLAERNQVNTSFGRASFAILLFQDLAIIPLLGFIPFLGPGASGAPPFSVLAALKVVGIIGGLLVGGRYLIRPLFRAAASATREVFTAAALLVVLGTGALMELTGLSMALGAFLSGLLLADSEYRHQLEADIEPFKGLLLGLFFMAVGMSVDYGLVIHKPVLILSVVVGFMAIKFGVVYGVGRMAKFSHESSMNMAAVLPQGGEFAFVLFSVAVQYKVMPSSLSDLLIVAVTFSMGLTPFIVALNEKLSSRIASTQKESFDQFPSQSQPIIIAGFGRVGQIVGRVLRMQEIGYTALDHDPEQVQQVRRFGTEIFFGDASRLDLLEAAGAKSAKIFVLAIDDVDSSLRTVRAVKEHFPHLKIFARARNRQHVYELVALGTHVINRETFASSLELTHEILVELGISSAEAKETLLKFRGHDERTLAEAQGLYQDEEKLINFSKQSAQQLVNLFRSDKS